MADHLQVEGLGFRVMTLLGTSTEENLLRYRAYRGCYSFHGVERWAGIMRGSAPSRSRGFSAAHPQ